MHALDLKLVVCECAGVGECGKLNLPKVFRMRLPPKTSRQDSMARLRAPLVLGIPSEFGQPNGPAAPCCPCRPVRVAACYAGGSGPTEIFIMILLSS